MIKLKDEAKVIERPAPGAGGCVVLECGIIVRSGTRCDKIHGADPTMRKEIERRLRLSIYEKLYGDIRDRVAKQLRDLYYSPEMDSVVFHKTREVLLEVEKIFNEPIEGV